MLKLRRDKPSQAAGMAGGRRGGGDVDDDRKVARVPSARNAPEQFVVQPGNESIDRHAGVQVDTDDGKRDELSFERERVEAFHRLVANEPWRPHQPKRQRTSYPGDWWLVS
jgi:hypothetical protein